MGGNSSICHYRSVHSFPITQPFSSNQTLTMIGILRYVKFYLVGKYQSFRDSDNSFVVMMFCNRLVGIFDNPNSELNRLHPVKYVLLTIAIVYTLLETSSIIFFKPFNMNQHFEILFMTFSRQLCVILWISLAVCRGDLKQIWIYLFDLQRNTPDERRSKPIRTINRFTLIFLMQNLFPTVVWSLNGRSGSPIFLYKNDLINMFNAILIPIAVVVLTFMFHYSMIVVCSILPALTLEFRLLGLDFERIFEDVGSLEETVRSAANHWDKLEQAFVSCVERHQTLLNTAATFRQQLKIYFLIQLGIDFIVIVLSTLIYAFTRQQVDSSFVFTVFAAIANLFNLLLFGFLCDQMEEQVGC
ncbi:uncharacterized protein LOC135702175 [Ochlerotatus camptorhynchus]|uniref:uncharacterized protein LOC135702175 n=1 Tax=Ochlerotatus camptorhynchus TaxID=644619 RepID=UPI0031E37534